MKEQRILNFESEEEEAHWWFDHREETSQWMEDALREGSTLKLADVLKNEPERELHLWSRIDPSDIPRAHWPKGADCAIRLT